MTTNIISLLAAMQNRSRSTVGVGSPSEAHGVGDLHPFVMPSSGHEPAKLWTACTAAGRKAIAEFLYWMKQVNWKAALLSGGDLGGHLPQQMAFQKGMAAAGKARSEGCSETQILAASSKDNLHIPPVIFSQYSGLMGLPNTTTVSSPMLGSFVLGGRKRSYVTAGTPQLVVQGVNAVKTQLGLLGANPKPAKLASGAWVALLPQRWAHAHKGTPGPAPFKVDRPTLKLLGDDGDSFDFTDIFGIVTTIVDPIQFVKDVGDTLGIEPSVPGSTGEAMCNIRGLSGEDVFWNDNLGECVARTGPMTIPAVNGECIPPLVVDPANAVDPILCITDPNPPPDPTCGEGFFLNEQQQCQKLVNCADGFIFSAADDSCVKIAKVFGCPAGAIKDTNDDCWQTCTPGEIFRGPNSPGNPFPDANCYCKPGTHRDAALNCVPDGGSGPPAKKDPPAPPGNKKCPGGSPSMQKVSINGDVTLECKKTDSGGGFPWVPAGLAAAAVAVIAVVASGGGKKGSSKHA